MASAGGSLLLASTAQAVITGISVVPVSFEQGWLESDGSVAVNSSTPTTDLALHASVQAAWAGSLGGYKTVRLYLATDDLGTNVNGIAGDDVAHIQFLIMTMQKDGTSSPRGFFNYQTGAIASGEANSSAAPQQRGANNNAQGQRAYDSYLTVGGADQSSNSGAPIEGSADMFDAVRGRVGAANAIQTGGTGNGFSAATKIDCENCGFLAVTAINPVSYSYNTAASLAYNGGLPITGQGVLVGQFTVSSLDGLVGTFLAVGQGTTQDAAFTFDFAWNVPSPGALALLGLAGVAARRRRRS